MVLKVDFAAFPKAVQRYAPGKVIFIASEAGRVILTASDPMTGMMLQTQTSQPMAKVQASLEAEGFTVDRGRWVPDLSEGEYSCDELFVAAVAYRSSEAKPGLWVDVFPSKPSTSDVLNAFFEEFSAEGMTANLSLDQFIRMSEPNVVVLDPGEITAFLAKKHPVGPVETPELSITFGKQDESV